MTIPIRRELALALIRHRFGSIRKLAVEWDYRVEEGIQRRRKAPSHQSISRWLEEGVPRNSDALFGLAATLDIDPTALMNIDRQYMDTHFQKERRMFRLNNEMHASTSPLWKIYAPEFGWPDHALAQDYYRRNWYTVTFSHDAAGTTNVYAAVVLKPDTDTLLPRAFHFAWRKPSVPQAFWRPYGTIVRFEDNTILASEGGDFQSVPTCGQSVVVETLFGPGQAEFCVASLHAFDHHIEVPSHQTGCVRFS